MGRENIIQSRVLEYLNEHSDADNRRSWKDIFAACWYDRAEMIEDPHMIVRATIRVLRRKGHAIFPTDQIGRPRKGTAQGYYMETETV